MLTIADIYAAKNRIYSARNNKNEHISQTRLLFSHALSELCGIKIYLKLENEQVMGSFKMRGALNKLLWLKEKNILPENVCGASAGNAGGGLAWAADLVKIHAHIVVPNYAAQSNIRAMERYNAFVEVVDGSLHDAEIHAKELAEKNGWMYVSPYNDAEVMAGQGTIMLEILEQNPEIKTVIIPIGGGGLFSGCAIAATNISPNCGLYGVQARHSPDMYNLLNPETHYYVGKTIAGGLAGKIDHQSATIPIVREHCRGIALVEEENMKEAMIWFMAEHRKIAEPSGAAGIAAILNKKFIPHPEDGPIAILVTGKNVDEDFFDEICAEHLAKKKIGKQG